MEDKIGEVFGAENFEGFDEAMFSQFMMFVSILDAIGCMLIIPLLTDYFKINDTVIQMCTCLKGNGR